MKYKLLVKSVVVTAMGIAALSMPKPAKAFSLCYTCWNADACSETEGEALCATMGGELCPYLRQCTWAAGNCLPNQVFYECWPGP